MLAASGARRVVAFPVQPRGAGCSPVGPWPTLTLVLEFELDDAKSDGCFRDRGFDFQYASGVFLDANRIAGRDRRWDYGKTDIDCSER